MTAQGRSPIIRRCPVSLLSTQPPTVPSLFNQSVVLRFIALQRSWRYLIEIRHQRVTLRSVGCLSLNDVAENACPYRLCIGVHHGLSVYEPHEQYVASRSKPACAYANNVQDHACYVDQTPNSRCLISLHSLNCARSQLILAFILRPFSGGNGQSYGLAIAAAMLRSTHLLFSPQFCLMHHSNVRKTQPTSTSH